MLGTVWIALILGLPNRTKALYFPFDAAAASSPLARFPILLPAPFGRPGHAKQYRRPRP